MCWRLLSNNNLLCTKILKDWHCANKTLWNTEFRKGDSLKFIKANIGWIIGNWETIWSVTETGFRARKFLANPFQISQIHICISRIYRTPVKKKNVTWIKSGITITIVKMWKIFSKFMCLTILMRIKRLGLFTKRGHLSTKCLLFFLLDRLFSFFFWRNRLRFWGLPRFYCSGFSLFWKVWCIIWLLKVTPKHLSLYL